MAAFVAIERRVAEPMLPLGFFRRRAFTGVQLAAFAVSGSMFALFLYLTLYLQSFLGFSPIEAGPALPADHGRLVHRRAARRDGAGQGPGPLPDGGGPGADRASGCC